LRKNITIEAIAGETKSNSDNSSRTLLQQKEMIVDTTHKCESTPATASTSLAGTDTEYSLTSTHYQQHKLPLAQQHRYGCTCREPPDVTLFDGSNMDRKNKETFIENLQTHGWSPIIVPKAPYPSPSQEEILAIFRRRRQRQQQNPDTENNRDVAFIAAESGSSEGTIEPKESLEVQLSKCVLNNNVEDVEKGDDEKYRREDDRDERTVKTWCRTLSWIAHKICELMLDLPENAFLPVDPNESLDLLRVFHYYAVSAETVKGPSPPSPSPTLGSSEHTDWGSLTVVWQDSVGGLQTYCRACKKWIDVKAAAAAAVEETTTTTTTETTKGPNHRWNCIVHVGDMASLVLDRNSDDENLSSNIDTNNTKNSISYPWPSPKHRVKSHPHKERASLVYFGYPPRKLSLDRIQKCLDEGWPHFSTRGQRLPLAEYYLLRNQSATEEQTGAGAGAGAASGDNETEARRLYQTMWSLPIQDIVRLKWEQVNRDG
jgi:hypothetical protein